MNIKQMLLVIITSLVISSGYSQRLVEDFTIVDVDGNEFGLYETLDDGKIVIINMISVHCSPCINYERLNILEAMWEEFGPNGTDEVYIITIEGNPNTSESAIFNGDHGEFMQGLSQPLANTDELYGHFDSGYYGFFEICSNRLAGNMYNFGYNTYPGTTQNCVSDSVNLDIMIIDSYVPSNLQVCDDGMYYNPEIVVQNVGLDSIFELKFIISQNDIVVDSILVTEEIARHEVKTIYLPELFLYYPYSFVSIEITEVNNESGDDDETNNVVDRYCNMDSGVQNYNIRPNNPLINIKINSGTNGHEIYWAIVDENETIIAEGGNAIEVGLQGGGANNSTPGNGYSNDSTYWESVVLPDEGCYEFIFVDNGGNLTPNGWFHYSLWSHDTTEIIASKNFKYASYDKRQFEYAIRVSTLDFKAERKIKLIPNPAFNNEFVIKVEAENLKELSYGVFNINGKIVQQETHFPVSGYENNIKVKIPDLRDGLYFVRIWNNDFSVCEKIMLGN